MKPVTVVPFISLFMILAAVTVATFRQPVGVDAVIPTRVACKEGMERERLLIAHVRSDGEVLIDGQPCPRDALSRRLKAVYFTRNQHMLWVDADPDTPYGQVAELLTAARTLSDRVALITPSQRGGPTDCYIMAGISGPITDYSSTRPIVDIKPVPWWPW
jgi:biopolymer transport protein ExbD